VYQFQAKKGQKLVFQVESRALGYPLDPVLRLLDGAGKLVAQVDDPGSSRTGPRDPELSFTVPQDGTYLLEVSDLHGSGGPRHVYRLRAVFPEPDYALTLAADRFVLTPGKPLDIAVTVVRRNGFDREVEVAAADLPEGVTAAPVKSLSSGASAKTVTLRLTATAGPLSVPLHLIGKVDGQPDLTRAAQAPLAGLNTVTPHLWLSAPKQ
jgi:hypothetical protein